MRLGLHYSLLSRVSELLLCALQLNIVTKPIHWRRFILYLHFSFKHMSTTPYWLHNSQHYYAIIIPNPDSPLIFFNVILNIKNILIF